MKHEKTMHIDVARLLFALLVVGGSSVACDRFEFDGISNTPGSGGAGATGGTSGIATGGAGPTGGTFGVGTGGANTAPRLDDAGELEGFGGDLGAHASTLALVSDAFRVVRRSDDEVIVSGSDRLEQPPEEGDWVQCVNETSGLRWKRWLAHDTSSYRGRGQAAVDSRGHTWFANSFAGALRIGETTVTSVVNPGMGSNVFDERGAPSDDLFLAEFDENGGLVSLRTFGGVGRQSLFGLKLDANDNLVLVGTFTGRMDVGDVELTSSGGSLASDLFVLRLSAEGEALRVDQFAQQGLMVNDIALDSQNRVVIAGSSHASGFLGEPNRLELGAGWAFALTEDGEIAWHSNFGSLEGLSVLRVAIDGNGNGIFSLNVDAAAPVFDTPPGAGRAAVVKLDPAGEPLFVKRFGETSLDAVHGIAILPDDSLVIGGHFYAGIDLGGGRFEVFHPNAYDADAFAARLSAEGEHIWSLHAGGRDSDYGPDVALVRPDRVVLLGSFTTAIDWGDGPVLYQGGPYVAWLAP